MLSNTLATLLKLPAKDRIELAMALWESLADEEREAGLRSRECRRCFHHIVRQPERCALVCSAVAQVALPESLGQQDGDGSRGGA